VNKVKRAYPLAKLIAQLGFSSAAMLLLVSWSCGERYFLDGLAIGIGVLAVAGVAALLILLLAPLVLDEDNRGPGGRR
jgi:hypothetical protein